MDIKAMAKSKRSHTRHHQPRKPIHPSSKAPPSSSSASVDSSDPKMAKKEARDRKKQVQSPSLPSNWDRYEDEGEEDGEQVADLSIDSGSNDPTRPPAKAAPDVVKPKSKGANFGELIAQAKESKSNYLPSFHDTLPDFYQGLGPMLSARGESILSWEGGDDFLADDEATTSQEAALLSLDLQDLAQQLAKVDLAKRLFIEEDVLPPELRAQGANESADQMFSQKSERQKNTRTPESFDELLSLYLEEEQIAEEKDVDNNDMKPSSAVITTSNLEPASTADVTNSKLDDVGFLDTRETSLVTRVTENDSEPSSGFEAAAAEAELDMLLNSFSKTKLFDSLGTHSEVAISTKQQETSTAFPAGDSSLDIPVTSSLDDALDSLLQETSNQDNKGGLPQSSVEVKATPFDIPSSSSSTSHPSSKSKALEDFDSWFDTI